MKGGPRPRGTNQEYLKEGQRIMSKWPGRAFQADEMLCSQASHPDLKAVSGVLRAGTHREDATGV